VVFLHAGVGDRRLWDAQVGPFAERYRVIRPDARGYGETALPGVPFSYVGDVEALLDELGIASAAVVGNSFGGKIALDLALGSPGRVAALVVAAPALSGAESSPELEALGDEEDRLLDDGKLDEAVELNVRAWAGELAPEQRSALAAMQRHAFEVQLAAYEADPAPGPVASLDPPAAGRLAELDVPVLVVVGDDDLEHFWVVARRIAAEAPRARLVTMAGAKHLLALERPAEFNELVLGFLADVFPAAGRG
jgi:3-oxoadipate enol-lactonase